MLLRGGPIEKHIARPLLYKILKNYGLHQTTMVIYQIEHIQFAGTRVLTFGREPQRDVLLDPHSKLKIELLPKLPILCKAENWTKFALDQREMLRMLAIEQMVSLNWQPRNIYLLRIFCVYNYVNRGLALKERAFMLPEVEIKEIKDFIEKFHKSLSIVLDNYVELFGNTSLARNYADVFDGRLYHLCLLECGKDSSFLTLGDELWLYLLQLFQEGLEDQDCRPIKISAKFPDVPITNFATLAIVNNNFMSNVVPGKIYYAINLCLHYLLEVASRYKSLEGDYKQSFHWDRYKSNYHWHNGKEFGDSDRFEDITPAKTYKSRESELYWKQKNAARYQKFVDTLLVGGVVRQIAVAKEDLPEERAIKKDTAMKALHTDYKSK